MTLQRRSRLGAKPKKPGHARCPFCGAGGKQLAALAVFDGWAVHCEVASCNIAGPVGDSEEDAWAKWDRRKA